MVFSWVLLLGTGLYTFLRGEESTWEREVRVIPRSTGNCFKRLVRTRTTVLHDIIIPGHCIIITPGHCLSGRYTRWLVGMRIVYPVETAFM